MEHVDAQQRSLKERNNIFVKTILNQGYFTAAIRVNCCVPIDGARKLVLGTDAGIYVTDRKPKDASQKPRRVLDCKNVTQVDVLEQHNILLVLSEKTMYSYPMEALDPEDTQPQISKRGRKICHANFFRAGVCQGQQLVCPVKTSSLSTTIKAYEPMDSMTKKSKKSGIAKMLQGSQDVLKPLKVWHFPPRKEAVNFCYVPEDRVQFQDCILSFLPNLTQPQEFYIPTESTSIHFLRSKLCVGCARGFEVVSLETLEAQSLLDQADTSLDFVQRKENIKPIHIERIATEFLLCYTDYSFFVNRNGWRARPDWIIEWEGTPQAFAIFNPYILAFEPNFIEIRHMDNGQLVHIITAKNIRMLHSSSREVIASMNGAAVGGLLTRNARSSTRTKTSSARTSSRRWTSGADRSRRTRTVSRSRTRISIRRRVHKISACYRRDLGSCRWRRGFDFDAARQRWATEKPHVQTL